MTQLGERERVRLTVPTSRTHHLFELILGIVGAIGTGVGAFLYFGDPLGTINVLGWTSQVGVIAAGWGYALQIAGALLVSGSLAIFSRKVLWRIGYWTSAARAGAVTAIAALAYAATFTVLYLRWLT